MLDVVKEAEDIHLSIISPQPEVFVTHPMRMHMTLLGKLPFTS